MTKKKRKLYNYADDNTVSHADKNLKKLTYELVEISLRLADNKMKANPGKFLTLAVGKHTHS